MTLLSIEHIYKQYDEDNHALIDFSLKIKKGSIWSLVGESGSGKSTLLRIIAGLEVQDRGEVYFNGETVLNPAQKLVPGYEEIQLIHQDHHLFPHSTVAENIARPLLLFDKAYKEERLEYLLQLLDLEAHRHKLPRELSGGQQQKVAIGRALSIEPEILLLDEPFSSLDIIQKRILIAELKTIFKKLKVTVIQVTHDIDDAMTMTDQLCIIRKGRIVQKGKSENIHQHPKSYYVAKLLSELNPIPDQSDSYIRASEVIFDATAHGVRGKVREVQYLVAHNLLKVRVKGSSLEWTVEDRERKYKKGEDVDLSWEQKKTLYLK
ncbi:MAG TPA: ABC transporter ATP-binding protein [Cyclobacteriaceae bacterium]|nr:ABC transporter ATP-binding protein [Cyclobacteriaceae bacterium]